MRNLGLIVLVAIVAIVAIFAGVGYVTQTVPAFDRAITRTADVRPQSPIGDPAGAVSAVFDRISVVGFADRAERMQLACDHALPSCESGNHRTYTIVIDADKNMLAVSRVAIPGSSLPSPFVVGVANRGGINTSVVDPAAQYYIVDDSCVGLYATTVSPTESACL